MIKKSSLCAILFVVGVMVLTVVGSVHANSSAIAIDTTPTANPKRAERVLSPQQNVGTMKPTNTAAAKDAGTLGALAKRVQALEDAAKSARLLLGTTDAYRSVSDRLEAIVRDRHAQDERVRGLITSLDALRAPLFRIEKNMLDIQARLEKVEKQIPVAVEQKKKVSGVQSHTFADTFRACLLRAGDQNLTTPIATALQRQIYECALLLPE